MVAGTARPNLLPAGHGLNRLAQGATGPLLGDLAETQRRERHGRSPVYAVGHSNRTGAGQGLEAGDRGEPFVVILPSLASSAGANFSFLS